MLRLRRDDKTINTIQDIKTHVALPAARIISRQRQIWIDFHAIPHKEKTSIISRNFITLVLVARHYPDAANSHLLDWLDTLLPFLLLLLKSSYLGHQAL